jgi:hypothetical protein
MHFFTKVRCTFWKSVRKDGFFDGPIDLFIEKNLSSLRRDNEPFWELKRSKKKPLNISKYIRLYSFLLLVRQRETENVIMLRAKRETASQELEALVRHMTYGTPG